MTIKKLTDKYKDCFYVVARVLVGFLFLSHGGQKLFGWFGGSKVASMASLMGVAGVIEFFGGLAILLGLFTRLGALLGAITMVVAYFKVHFPGGAIPIVNKGELAVLYFAVFLIIMVHGNGKWSLEKKLMKKETF